MNFYKYNGLGNDFIIINCLDKAEKPLIDSNHVKAICDVHTEVGADGKTYPLNVALTRITNRFPWQNQLNPLDVDRVDGVNPLDVLALINAINLIFTAIFPEA